MKWLFLVGVFCSMVNQAQVLVQRYGVKDGLPQTNLSAIAEDSLGYLWLGTFGGGVARFDGKIFTNYTAYPELPSNMVNDMLVDSRQNIWISTRKGLVKLSGEKVQHVTFSSDGSIFSRRLLLKRDTVICLLNDGKRVYIDNDTTYHEYHGLPERVMQAMRTNQGDAAFFYQKNSSNFLLILTREGTSNELRCDFDQLYSVFRRGDRLIVSTNKGLYRVGADALEQINTNTYPVFGYIEMYQSYLGIKNNRLFMIDEQGNLRLVNQSINARINSVVIDREGLIWLASDAGLIKIQPQSFFKTDLEPERSEPVMAVHMKDGFLWVGTMGNGIQVYKDNKLYRSIKSEIRNRNAIVFFKEGPDGRMWAGTSGGLAVFDGFEPTWIDPEVISTASSMDFNPEGEAFVSSLRGGIYFLNAKRKASEVENSRTLIVSNIEYHEKSNTFLVGTNLGLKVIDKGVVQDRFPTTRDLEILSMDLLSQDTILLGTSGNGVVLYPLGGSKLFQFNKKRGLSSDNVFFVFADGRKAWVGTDRGIDLVSIGNLGSMRAEYQYGFLDGLAGMETNANAYWKMDHVFLAGLVDGLYEFGRTRNEENSNLLHVRATVSNNPPMVLSDQPLVVNYDENQLNFAFTKVNKSYPDKYYYTYRLKNIDANWSQPTQAGAITYSNLMPGKYELHIKVVDQSGKKTFDETQISFEVKPAYYQTAWFKVGVALLFGLLAGAIVWKVNESKVSKALQLQEIKENEKNRLRKEIARDFHDELGNLVARLINYLGLLNINKSIDPEIYRSLNSFAQRILIGAKDFVWTLDPGNDELNNVVVHLKDFGESMFSEKNINFRFTGEINGRLPLPIGHSRQINLIFKEAMTNAFRHSGATEVNFSFLRNHKTVTLMLVDNGKGIDREMLLSSRGINNIQTRAQRINAWLKLFSEPGKTKLTLEMKLP